MLVNYNVEIKRKIFWDSTQLFKQIIIHQFLKLFRSYLEAIWSYLYKLYNLYLFFKWKRTRRTVNICEDSTHVTKNSWKLTFDNPYNEGHLTLYGI